MLKICVIVAFVIGALFVARLILSKLKNIERKVNIMATKTDLDAAIAALPAAIETAVTAAVQPVIDAITAKSGPVDLQPEIDQLNGIAAAVSAKIAADLTPPAAPDTAPTP